MPKKKKQKKKTLKTVLELVFPEFAPNNNNKKKLSKTKIKFLEQGNRNFKLR